MQTNTSPSRKKGSRLTQQNQLNISRMQTNLQRAIIGNVKQPLPNKDEAGVPEGVLVLNNFTKFKKMFGKPITIEGNKLKTINTTHRSAFDWHVNSHADVIACVPTNHRTISTQCLIKTDSGQLKTMTYNLHFPQALVFNSNKTHRAPSDRNTGVALYKLLNRSYYDKLKNGQLELPNVHSMRDIFQDIDHSKSSNKPRRRRFAVSSKPSRFVVSNKPRRI